jgi:hypothetical protein
MKEFFASDIMKKQLAYMLSAISIVGLFAGCENDTTPSLFDPEAVSRPDPVISSVTPPDTFAVAGVVTIAGSNFSAVKEENLVFFDDELGAVLEASPGRLKVQTPNLVKDGVALKIAAYKASKFSNIINYNLGAAVAPPYNFTPVEVPWSIACDAQNVYASMVVSAVGIGVQKFAADGARTDYSPKPSGTPTRYNGMKFGPNGFLYGVTFERRILQIPAGGGNPVNWVVLPNTSVRLNDLDFDRQHNLWTAGSLDLHRIRLDNKNVKSFPFAGTVRSVRVFNDAVYLAGRRDDAEKIWRVPILSADEVGPEEEYFDFSAKYTGTVLAITFAADGDLYIGTDAPESIVLVHPDKSSEALYDGLFPTPALAFVRVSLFPTPALSFAWDTGNFLYVTQQANPNANPKIPQTILKVNMQKKGAPYYGRGDL